MIYNVAEILKGRLSDLTWIDSLNGLVTSHTMETQTEKGEPLLKTVPVYCGEESGCDINSVDPLVPDGKTSCMVYFEERTPFRLIGNERDWFYFRGQLMLVCWVNLRRLGVEGCDKTTLIKNSIFKNLFFEKQNFVDYEINAMSAYVQEEVVKNQNIFSKWNYYDRLDKMLQAPYDYFAIIVEADFRIHRTCLSDFVPGTTNNC